MRFHTLLTFGLLALPVAASAADVVCGTSQQLCVYRRSVSLADIVPFACDVYPLASPVQQVTGQCFAIPTSQITAQRALTQNAAGWRFLAVEGGLAVLKPQEVRDAIVRQEDEAATNRAALDAEAETNLVCTAETLAAIETLVAQAETFPTNEIDEIQPAVDALDPAASPATFKQQLSDAFFHVTQAHRAISTSLFALVETLAKCTKVLQGGE
jgi:hypothetical protein